MISSVWCAVYSVICWAGLQDLFQLKINWLLTPLSTDWWCDSSALLPFTTRSSAQWGTVVRDSERQARPPSYAISGYFSLISKLSLSGYCPGWCYSLTAKYSLGWDWWFSHCCQPARHEASLLDRSLSYLAPPRSSDCVATVRILTAHAPQSAVSCLISVSRSLRGVQGQKRS